MTLRQRGEYWYGDSHGDLRSEMTRYAEQNGYPIDDFVDVRCKCGNDTFHLLTDEEAVVAIRHCNECGHEHMMGDSADFADEAEVGQHECVCEADVFQDKAGSIGIEMKTGHHHQTFAGSTLVAVAAGVGWLAAMLTGRTNSMATRS